MKNKIRTAVAVLALAFTSTLAVNAVAQAAPAPAAVTTSVANPTSPWDWFVRGLGCYKVKAPYCYSSAKAVRGR